MYIWIYFSVGIALLLAMIYQCRWQSGSQRAGDAVFMGLVVLTLAFLRIPSLCFNEEMNADESQVIASAITLLQDPVYGHTVDGTTIGPLNSYVLLLPHLLGLPLDYRSARLVALVLITGSLLLFYLSLRRVASPLASRISTLFLTLFFAWTSQYDFLHFSSELTSLLLINACLLLAFQLLTTGRPTPAALLGIGALAGLTPYAKLQVLPIVGMLLLALGVYLVSTYRRRASGLLLTIGVGFMMPTVLVFGLAYYFSVSDYFINFYFISSLVTYNQLYADVPLVHQGLFQKLLAFPHFLGQYVDFAAFVILPGCVTLVGVLVVGAKSTAVYRFDWPTGMAGAMTLGALGAVIAPGTEFGHHLLLLVFPVGWLTGLALNRLSRDWFTERTSVRVSAALVIVCLGTLWLTNAILQACSLPVLNWVRQAAGPSVHVSLPTALQTIRLRELNPCLAAFPDRTEVRVSPVARMIGRYALPSDRLAVWGWHCSYYVETQLAQGVSEAQSQRSIIPNQMQALYLKRYTRELIENRPAIFLDAVGRNSLFLDRPDQHCEFYDGVRSVIRDNYTFVANVQDVRIYVRNNSLTERRRPPVSVF